MLLITRARRLHIGTLSYLFFRSLKVSRSERPAGQRSSSSALPLLAALSPPPRAQGPPGCPSCRTDGASVCARLPTFQTFSCNILIHHPSTAILLALPPLLNCLRRTLNLSYLARLPPIGSTFGSLRCPVGDYGGGATMYFQRYGAAVTYRDGPGTHIYIPLTSS